MSLSNCKRCGTLFSRINQPICPKCLKKEDELLVQAHEWLRDNPGKTINVMSEALEINKHQILTWIRQKRITMGDKNEVLICKRCAEGVPDGTLCDRCKLLLSHDVSQGIKAIKESALPLEVERKGMHYRRAERVKRLRS